MKNVVMMSKYNTWVNAHIFNLCSSISDSEYRLDRGVFFGSIHNTLNHILLVDRLWVTRLMGGEDKSIHSLDQILYEDFEELQNAQIEGDQLLEKFADNLDDSGLAERINYQRMDGRHASQTVQEILSTLFNHQTHHRGQIHAMLTQAGFKNSDLPDIDIVDYLGSEAIN